MTPTTPLAADVRTAWDTYLDFLALGGRVEDVACMRVVSNVAASRCHDASHPKQLYAALGFRPVCLTWSWLAPQ